MVEIGNNNTNATEYTLSDVNKENMDYETLEKLNKEFVEQSVLMNKEFSQCFQKWMKKSPRLALIMIIYVHKVHMNPEDGWGRSTGLTIEILGRYQTKEKAIEAKNKRDKSSDATYCDVGQSWIEEEQVE